MAQFHWCGRQRPDNLIARIVDPLPIEPGTAMRWVRPASRRDIAAFLYPLQ